MHGYFSVKAGRGTESMDHLATEETANEVRPIRTAAPSEGEALEVREGILWVRLPLPMALDHVNIFACRDRDGWTLIDSGMNVGPTRSIMKRLMAGPLGGEPVRRVILTHHHPDHVGLAGWFKEEFDVEIHATRTAWLMARMLTLDEQQWPTSEALLLMRRAGVPMEMIAKYEQTRPFNFADCVHPIPTGFQRMQDGDILDFAGRGWTVRIGHGHAPSHATFWCNDEPLVIGGDQFLPDITPNIGVYPTEPDANPLSEWLESCRRFCNFAADDHLVLPGHKSPFLGLPVRLRQLIANHERALRRLCEFLGKPATAHQSIEPLFERPIRKSEYGLAMAETLAHLNYLLSTGEVDKRLDAQGAWRWKRI